jgi:hypothetical protein
MLPTVADHLHQMFSLVFPMLRRAHLLPVQPFPKLQPDRSCRVLGDEVGRVIGIMNPGQTLPREVREADFQIVQG